MDIMGKSYFNCVNCLGVTNYKYVSYTRHYSFKAISTTISNHAFARSQRLGRLAQMARGLYPGDAAMAKAAATEIVRT
jgi:hypothetical protein